MATSRSYAVSAGLRFGSVLVFLLVLSIGLSVATPVVATNTQDTTTVLVVVPDVSDYRQTVGLTARVYGVYSGISPYGQVDFESDGSGVGSQMLSGGFATLSVDTIPAGTHAITARYIGAGGFMPSVSSPVRLTVDMIDSTTSISSSCNPCVQSTPVTFTATISEPSATGSVTFYDGTNPIGTTVVTDGHAHLVTSALSAGDHLIRAEYGGDINLQPSVSTDLNQSITGVFGITVLESANGKVTPGGTNPVIVGQDSPVFSFTPDPGYHVATIALDGGSAEATTATSYVFHNVNAPHTIRVTFEPYFSGMPVWRFRNMHMVGSYLWTSDPAEKANIIATLGKTWSYEGVAFIVNRSNPLNSTPLWRFRNLRRGTYFYTANAAEKADVEATQSKTWTLEGVAWNVSLTPTNTPVWRFRCLKDSTHLWTSDPNEKLSIESTLGKTYQLEGIAYWIGQ